MTPRRQLLLLATVTLCAVLVVKLAQIALTPELLAALAVVGRAAIRNVVVQALLVTAAFCGLVSLCVAAWERSERRYERETRERAEEQARVYRSDSSGGAA